MGFQFNHEAGHLLIHVSGRLTAQDYAAFVPAADRLIGDQGIDRLLVDLDGFEGWSLGAAMADLQFSIKHFADIERIAVVGDKDWEEALTLLFKPFTLAKVRYFHREDIDRAREWIERH